jgi:outer membrane protein OmpA-like peptidoglycan-associated protein
MPERATAEVTPPAQQQTTEIKPEVSKQQETQPAVTSETKISPPSPEKVNPMPERATAEVTSPAQQQTTEIKPEVTKQEETQPTVTSEKKIPPPSPEKVIPMPERATTEVTPPTQQQTTEIKPEVPQHQEPQPEVTSETKNPPPSSEKVIPMPERATAEVTPPVQQQTTEIKPEVTKQQETQPAMAVETKEPPPSLEKVVPVPEPVTTQVTPPAQQQTTEIKPEVIKQQETQPAMAVETKEPPPSPEKVIPMPERATAEVTPSAQQQTTEIKPNVSTQQEPQPEVTSEKKITPPSSEKVIPMPERATAEVTPPAQQQTTEIKPEVPTQQETQLVVNAETKVSPPSPEKVVPIPAQVITEAEPNLQQPQTGKVSGTIIAESTLQKVIVSGCIKDRSNNVVIPSATIFFLNEKNGKVYVHKTNSTGCFKSELISGIDYKVKAMQTGYLSDCIPYSSPVSNTLAEATLSNDLLLDNAGVMQTYKIENIYYDFDRYFIRADAEPTLKKLIRIMNEIPITVELGSHADCRGSDAYNMILTEKRANSTFQYIVKGGIDGSRITRHWYGKTQLTNNCNCAEGVHCTEAQHQANRRTEFKISVPSSIMKETAIDLEKYHDGDTLDLHFLPADFFENCNHRLISGPLAELLKSTSTMPEEQKPGVLYTVQIGAFSFITPHFTSLNEVMSCRGSDGILRCFVGKFSTKQEAIWYRDHLRASDFKDAFVTEMDSKHNPSISGQISYLSLK